MARLKDISYLGAVVPDGWKIRADDLDIGGRGLDHRALLEQARRLLSEHLNSVPLACVIVEDPWAEKQYPCGQNSLPWIVIERPDYEELYWVCDKRQFIGSDAVLGAATGRRFLAVLSTWDSVAPELCTSLPDSTLDKVSLRARALLTEIYDGEAYLVAEFGNAPAPWNNSALRSPE